METITFEVIWSQVASLHCLPIQAIDHVPNALSNVTKKALMQKSPEEIVTIISGIIDEINAGSVKTIDELVEQRLKRKVSHVKEME